MRTILACAFALALVPAAAHAKTKLAVLGAAGNAASNIVLTSGSLQYTGAGETTDRNLTIGTGGGSLLGSGTGALAWNGITSLAGANTLALGGTSAATVGIHSGQRLPRLAGCRTL